MDYDQVYNDAFQKTEKTITAGRSITPKEQNLDFCSEFDNEASSPNQSMRVTNNKFFNSKYIKLKKSASNFINKDIDGVL